ncbi:dTDP-4-dehydrorhamnose 3,5-epimerase [Vibrio nomapromontoriensis]|uniref:dTDP-4-dehydrorhamnose 3,5-epimerase n=1 Tax=Vibrio nomapromontoriensis TaxID=2910246 RepID=UPI003D137E19
MSSIDGVIVTPLKVIPVDKGDVLHGIKASEDSFHGFGEAYFSTILYKQVKGWKKHTEMTMNIVVPEGAIKFVMYDARLTSHTHHRFFSIIIDKQNYCRLTVPQGIWMAFEGVGSGTNLLMNFANMEHIPQEAENKPLEDIPFNWSDDE